MPTCEICGSKKKLVVDHCHTSMLVRGVLCQNCNRLLGYYESNNERIKDNNKYVRWISQYEKEVNAYLAHAVTTIPFKSNRSKQLKKKLKPSWNNN